MLATLLAGAMTLTGAAGDAPRGGVLCLDGAAAQVAAARPRARRIDLELQSAEILEVLRLFSDIGGVNIVAKPGVTGTVTVKLYDIPWTDALRGILRSLSLGMVWEGNVIYVTPLDRAGRPGG